jgi:hypothetical protein
MSSKKRDDEAEDDDEEEEEEDERISKLISFIGKHTAEESSSYLKNDLGGKDGIVRHLMRKSSIENEKENCVVDDHSTFVCPF